MSNTIITKWQFTTTYLAEWYMVGYKRLAVPRQFLNHCALHVITGAYIVVYATSVYVLLWVLLVKEGGQRTLMVDDFQEEPGFHFVSA